MSELDEKLNELLDKFDDDQSQIGDYPARTKLIRALKKLIKTGPLS